MFLKKHHLHIPLWIGVILLLIIVFRIPSLFEPYYYGDEMIYLTLGEGMNKGLTLYKDIHDNKPPLLYLTAYLATNLFWFKAILMIWSLVTTLAFWKLTQLLFKKSVGMQKVSVVIFAILTTIPLLEGNIVNSELFMIGFSILAFLILLKKNLSTKMLLLGGILFSLATLYKVPAAFDVPAIFIYWLITKDKNREAYLEIIKKIVVVSIGFTIPLFITFTWYFFRGALNEYLIAGFLQNVGYLSSFRPDDVQKTFFDKNAPLLFRAFVVLLFSVCVFLFKRKLSKVFILSSLWLIFTLFAVTLSERPYPHYLLQSMPAISLLIGILIASSKIEQPFTVLPLFFAIFVPVYFKFYYYNTFSYYARFGQFALGKISKEQYFDQFDKNASRNYAISDFLQKSSSGKDKIFVWGDSSTIYALSRRLPPIKYVANYHIYDFSSKAAVATALLETPASFVVILPDSPDFSELTTQLRQKYINIKNINGANIYKFVGDKKHYDKRQDQI